MPEGHSIHRAALDHTRALAGQLIAVTSPQGRFDAPALTHGLPVRLLAVDAYGKHLLYRFEGGHTVHVHLGLFGKFYRRKQPAPSPRPTTRMRLAGEAVVIDLVGPTACELLTAEAEAQLRARLGPDPLRADAESARFVEYAACSRMPIGALLLDQSVIAGVGNVYRAEVLHMLHIHPATPARRLSGAELVALWELLCMLLARGVRDRRIITTAAPASGPRSARVHVYRRRQCASCAGPVKRTELRARTIYLCEVCQPARSEPPLSG